jgi:hypothetical protein
MGSVDTWVFCGPHPDDANLGALYASLGRAGVDVTFGPCLPADGSYTAAEPGIRYATVDVYYRLVELNAAHGIRTVVYDARVWSDDPQVRAQAVDYWGPMLGNIAAWDMGDEFDPVQYDLLEHRWLTMSDVVQVTGIHGFTNNLPGYLAGDTFTGLFNDLYSFDNYVDPVTDAKHYDPLVKTLMCAVNTWTHLDYRPTYTTIRATMKKLGHAGCDMFLVFGGVLPYGTDFFKPVPGWERAVLEGSFK